MGCPLKFVQLKACWIIFPRALEVLVTPLIRTYPVFDFKILNDVSSVARYFRLDIRTLFLNRIIALMIWRIRNNQTMILAYKVDLHGHYGSEPFMYSKKKG